MSKLEQSLVSSAREMVLEKSKAPSTKPDFSAMQKKDRQLVRGKFIFHEVPGGRMSFCFKKWKEDPVETYDLDDGKIYTLPLGVARHLNKECKYPIHAHSQDESGKVSSLVGQWVRRCSFQSLEFMEEEDLSPVGDSKVKE